MRWAPAADRELPLGVEHEEAVAEHAEGVDLQVRDVDGHLLGGVLVEPLVEDSAACAHTPLFPSLGPQN